MFQVSDPALQVLKETLESTRTEADQVLRLEARSNEFVLGLGEPLENDVKFETGGTLVLAASEEVAGLLEDATIDVETVDGQARLFLSS